MSGVAGSVNNKVVGELMRTAVHEAGHALMAYLTDVPFEHITIKPRDFDDLLGHVRLTPEAGIYYDFFAFKAFHRGGFQPRGYGNSRDVFINAKIRNYAESMMLVAATGPIAEYQFIGEPLEELTEYDWRGTPDGGDFSELGYAVTGSEVELWSYCGWMMERTWNIMKVPAHQLVVETLANKLIERKRLVYSESKEIMTVAFQDLRPGVLLDCERIMGVAA